MQIISADILSPAYKDAILTLWNGEYPATLHYTTTEFDSYLNNLPGHHHYLLTDGSDAIRGWAFTFTRDREAWFAIIIDSAMHGHGYGSLLLNTIQQNTNRLNGWVIDHDKAVKSNGAPYKSPLGFYTKHGFATHPNTRLETPKLSAVKISWERR